MEISLQKRVEKTNAGSEAAVLNFSPYVFFCVFLPATDACKLGSDYTERISTHIVNKVTVI